MEGVVYDGVKIFSATRYVERERLGEKISEWSRNYPNLNVVATRVLQSSDAAYHCHTIVVFWKRAQ